MAETAALARALDEAGDVGHDEVVLVEAHHAEMRFEGREGIVGDLGLGRRDPRDERALAGVGEADQGDVGHELELEIEIPLLADLALFGERRCAHLVREKARVATAALTAARRKESIPGRHQIGEYDPGLIAHHRPDRHRDVEIRPASAVPALALAVYAVAPRTVGVVAERQQRRHLTVGNQPDRPATPAVATVRAPFGHVRFTPERRRPGPTVAGLDVHLRFVNKAGHRDDPKRAGACSHCGSQDLVPAEVRNGPIGTWRQRPAHGTVGAMPRAIGDRVADALSSPEFSGPAHQRMLAVAQLVQLAVGLIALAAIWVLPGQTTRDRVVVTALVAFVYVPYSLISRMVAPMSRNPVARIANITVDVLVIGIFSIVIADTRVAVLFAYFLVVAFHAYVSGRTAGLVITGGAAVLALVAEHLAPPSERLSSFTLGMFVVVLLALAIMVDALAVERRRAARHLVRLHESMAQLGSGPDLAATVESVAAAARHAVDATFVAVLLDESKRLYPVSIVGTVSGQEFTGRGPERPSERGNGSDASERALQFPESSPSGVALSTGKPVIVADFETDERFSQWAPESRTYGFSSMVSIPFGHRDTPIGVLNAYFAKDRHADQDDIDLLIAYSRQASLMIERALAYQLEKEAGEQLAEADRLKSEFVSTVSHELRTPLTSISGFISTVLLRWDQLDDASKKELLERAAWNGGELRRMIEQVLSFSRLEGGMVDIHPAERSLGHEVRDIVDHMLPVLHQHRVEIRIPDEIIVMADGEGLQHILWNLLSNAAKFSPADTAITVTAERQAGLALAAVHDEGPGVAVDERDRVFERFYRSSTGSSARGTGIGLTVVRTYVERHGGKVWVESEPGCGSSFFFTLPLADEESAITRPESTTSAVAAATALA